MYLPPSHLRPPDRSPRSASNSRRIPGRRTQLSRSHRRLITLAPPLRRSRREASINLTIFATRGSDRACSATVVPSISAKVRGVNSSGSVRRSGIASPASSRRSLEGLPSRSRRTLTKNKSVKRIRSMSFWHRFAEIDQVVDAVRPADPGAPRADRHVPPAAQRLKHQEDVAHPCRWYSH